ncbi:MAG: S46 family peptidase, partial [Candidatus Krumholzibacteria bacterium]|nr:S46 family peptidase [Candidatus Krumholzibacteria bacterium]
FNYPSRIKMFGDLIAIYQDAAAADPGVAIKVASYDQMLNNAMKNYQGMLEGFEKAGLLEKKLKEEKSFTAWLENNKKMREKYGHIIPEIRALYDDNETYREKSQAINIMHFPCLLLRAGSTLSRWSEEKEKPDLEREPGYQERDVPRLEQGLRMIDMNYDRETDMKVMKYFLMMVLELPADQRIRAIDAVVEGEEDPGAAVDEFIKKLYSNTKLVTAEERLRMFGLSRTELLAEKDALVTFAGELLVERKELEEKDKAFGGALNKLRPKLIEAYAEWKGGDLYPDANDTMRLTYGTVKGYSPRDAVQYDYITTLSGVIEKCTGENPFDCPPKLVELYDNCSFGGYIDPVKGDVPVDFLSTCDITGGNSGSPILNGRGEVIGSAFDGNYESISADYIFNEELTRSINVDVRYILFVLAKFSGAQYLLDEMTIH